MEIRPTTKSIENVLQKALLDGIFSGEDNAVIFYDLGLLKDKIRQIKKEFPDDTIHAIAVKANPLIKVLKLFREQDTGLEAASLPEIHLALNSGFDSSEIYFDSPVKTASEIEFALSKNISLNIDSFPELERVAKIMTRSNSKSNIGLRINPQIGTGTISLTSVAAEYSKFGIPINSHREKIISAYKKYTWLNGIHLHIGSQGCSLKMLVDGVKKVYDLALEVNSIEDCRDQIRIFDIGGGIPVSYYFDKPEIKIKDYVNGLSSACPLLFKNNFKLVTEFGRYISANAGWTASRVEYIKEAGGKKTALIHVGADMFLRKCYMPQDWHHEITTYDKKGKLKKGGDTCKYTVAGPLCFAGDIIEQDIVLPVTDPGDFLVLHDTGAYTLSMWSRYNSRQIPKVVGYYNDGDDFITLKERENVLDLIKFWQ